MNIAATFGEGRLMVSPPKDCPPWIARRNHQFSPPARSNSAQQLSDFAKTPQRESVVPEVFPCVFASFPVLHISIVNHINWLCV
jgi:hypothetical protein